ncbi:MAG: hypothetical protein K1X50_18850 [Candidatus Promineofilum sp.]|nr:hypothetical protein [Promineifilum sp.]
MKRRFTVEEVEQAFRRVEDQVAAHGADTACLWAIHHAIEDGLRVLVGELSPEDDAPDEDDLRQAVLEARTVEEFDTAVGRLLALDRDEVKSARGGIYPGWRPSPGGNEDMMLTLTVWADKRLGALGRGASRSEAETFALVEARRVYRVMREG